MRLAPSAAVVPTTVEHNIERMGVEVVCWLDACNQLYAASVEGHAPRWVAQVLESGCGFAEVALLRDLTKRGLNAPPLFFRLDMLDTEKVAEVQIEHGADDYIHRLETVVSEAQDPVGCGIALGYANTLKSSTGKEKVRVGQKS